MTPGPVGGGGDLRALPKAHLHVHLDGAVRLDTLVELAGERGLPPPRLPEGERYESFGVFMDTIQAAHALLHDRDVVDRVLAEVVEDAASDGAVWIEVSLWPGLFDGSGLSREAWVETVLDLGRAAAARTGIGFGLMLAANRHESPDAALEVARIAGRHANDGVVSFGLDGDERVGPPASFTAAFRHARSAGLLATPHAGELTGPESVRVSLRDLGARRVLHGVRAVEDPDLVRALAAADVCLDVCPTSNVKLGVVESLQDHPLPQLLAAGVRCSINADDPLLFRTSLLEEYQLCRAVLGLSDAALAEAATASIRYSGAPEEIKADALQRIAAWAAPSAST